MRISNKKRFYSILTIVLLLIILILILWFQSSHLKQNNSNEINSEVYETDPIQEMLDSMTLEEKVGQLFLARVPENNIVEDINQYHLGGYLIFGRDVQGETKDSFKTKIDNWQEASKIKMLIASDEEGGEVTRVSELLESPFLAPSEIYQQGELEAVRNDTRNKCETLKSLGINVNLAPVADVAINPNSFIYTRTLALPEETALVDAADITSDFVSDVVSVMKEEKVGCSLKHFPGYGENGDTHTDIIHDSKPLDVFESIDFLPFKAGIEAGAGSVLISHNIVENIDNTQPASLSPAVHDILRNDLGFKGVIVTDDFDMAGLADYADQNTAAVQTINAGTDLIISSSYADQSKALVDAVNNKTISEERLNEAVTHVLKWKQDLNLI